MSSVFFWLGLFLGEDVTPLLLPQTTMSPLLLGSALCFRINDELTKDSWNIFFIGTELTIGFRRVLIASSFIFALWGPIPESRGC